MPVLIMSRITGCIGRNIHLMSTQSINKGARKEGMKYDEQEKKQTFVEVSSNSILLALSVAIVVGFDFFDGC